MPNLLFLTLKTFSATGGIENVCKILGKALYEYSLLHNCSLRVLSMHDSADNAVNNPYFPADIFTGYNKAKASYVWQAVSAASANNIVILSHINLLLAGWLIKKIKPSTTILLIAHGIEIWGELTSHQQLMLGCCHKIISVSQYTSHKVGIEQGVPDSRRCVLNNCIDPFLQRPRYKHRSPALIAKYNIAEQDKVLLTLTRLSAKDRYKGYDFVLHAVAELLQKNARVKYILAGSYQPAEKKYLDGIIKKNKLAHAVIVTGYLPDAELAAHFSLADMYIMPSIKEGFGIVFIEAMYYGVPVVATNADGSTDALLNGQLGQLIEPERVDEIVNAVDKIIANPSQYAPNFNLLMANFSYEKYKVNLYNIIDQLHTNHPN